MVRAVRVGELSALSICHLGVRHAFLSGHAGKRMEMRAAAFPPRCQVAVVDQWVDSGGSMRAAIELVERQQGVVRTYTFIHAFGCHTQLIARVPETVQ